MMYDNIYRVTLVSEYDNMKTRLSRLYQPNHGKFITAWYQAMACIQRKIVPNFVLRNAICWFKLLLETIYEKANNVSVNKQELTSVSLIEIRIWMNNHTTWFTRINYLSLP